jgi:DNA-binding MarR family transcriptional regulator
MNQKQPDFQRSTGYLLARLGSRSASAWQGMLRQRELTPHEHGVLLTLLSTGALGQKTLARHVLIDPRNLSAIVEDLVAKDLIQRETNPNDRRRRTLSLTQRGETVAKKLAQAAARIQDELLAGLSSPEQATLNALLSKLMASLLEN